MGQGNGANCTRRGLLKLSLLTAASAALPKLLQSQASEELSVPFTGPDSLRATATAHGILYGAAVRPELLDLGGMALGLKTNPYTELIAGQANIIVAENAMKWGPLRPTPSSFNFAPADRLIRFAALAGQRVRGHNLCWHEQLPEWFKSTVTRQNARQIFVDHIQAVAGRYRSQVHSWDVVNEAIEPKDGRADGLRNSPWLGLLGPEYVELAFQTAAVADPGAKLTYNDYGIELDTPEQIAKRGQVMMLLRRLKARNIPIHAVGIQSHLKAAGPQPGTGLQTFIRELRKMNLEVYITEMDVNTRGLSGGAPSQDDAVAQVYREYATLVLAEPNVAAMLTWGMTDAYTWLNETKKDWALREDGARQRPLPFDEQMHPVPAFAALRTAIQAARPTAAPIHPPAAHSPSSDLYSPFRVQGSPTAPPPPYTTVPTPRIQ